MFYTKYRPQKFSEISRPNAAADALVKQIQSGKTGHAYLFVGPRGTGKTTTARVLAKALNCSNLLSNGDPCDECDSCIAIKTGNFVDLIEIDAASNRGIDDIRDLKEKIRLLPSKGEKKVYIIDEVHMLTPEAFNALLKTLEEPPSHVVFILCTTESHKIPETIKSRCQVFKFKRASLDQLKSKLSKIAEKEQIAVTEEVLVQIASISEGGFRDAETLLQQIGEGELILEHFGGFNSTKVYIEFVDLLIKCDVTNALTVIKNVYESGIDLSVWNLGLLNYLRDLLLYLSGAIDENKYSEEAFALLERQAKKLREPRILKLLEVFNKSNQELKDTVIAQLPLEIAIITLCLNKNSTKQDNENKKLYKEQKVDSFNDPDFSDSENTDTHNFEVEIKPQSYYGNEISIDTFEETKINGVSQLKVEISEIVSSWDEIIRSVVPINNTVSAVLKSAKPISIDNEYLVIEVMFKFHKERLEAPKNRQILETVLNEKFGSHIPIKIKCVINSNPSKKKQDPKESGELTDLNVAMPSDVNILDIFDGGLPI